jgi:hypothetical protein
MYRDSKAQRGVRMAWQRATSALYLAIAAYCGYVLIVTLLTVARS